MTGTSDGDELLRNRETAVRWAGLEPSRGLTADTDSLGQRLVGYLRDCAAASSRALLVRNIYDGGCGVLPMGVDQIDGLVDGLRIPGRDAVDLALENELDPKEKPLALGALFVTGRHRRARQEGPTRYCAPLLIAPVTQSSDSLSATFTLAGDVGLNLALLADLLYTDGDEEEALSQRLEGLLDVVPDAPFDPAEIKRFCESLQVMLDLPFSIPELSGLDPTLDLAEAYAAASRLELSGATALYIGKDASELSVIRELEVIAANPSEGTALEPLLTPENRGRLNEDSWDRDRDGRPVEPRRPDGWHDDIEPIELTEMQRRVVARTRSQPLTVVTGPPGTGKSYSICAVVLDHLLADKTVLVTSGTNKAVEVVAEKLKELAGPYAVAVSGERGEQRALADAIQTMTSPAGQPGWYTTTQIENARARYAGLKAELLGLEQRLLDTLAQQGAYCFHADAIESLADITARFALQGVERTSERLRRLHEKANSADEIGWWRQWRARRALEMLRHQLGGTPEVGLDEMGLAVDALAHTDELARLAREIDSNPDLAGGWAALEELRRHQFSAGATILGMQRQTALAKLLDDTQSRSALRKFAEALRAAKPKAKQQLLQQVPVDVLLRAFPCWASKDQFLSHVLPLTPGLFDLTIIDESSQVNLAHAVPALHRGKRALIVGDPKQLRFVSFLSRAAETAAFSRHNIPPAEQGRYRFSRRSLFDVADDFVAQRNSLILDEHFRSQPQIIAFSNREFYRGTMRIMTERPHSAGAKTVDLVHVPGHRDRQLNLNERELDEMIEIARRYIDQADRGGEVKTLGLLSPYRNQTDALLGRVRQAFTAEQVSRHQITTGTAYSLQGDERDIVAVSTVIDAQFHHGSLRFLEDPNLLNVAVTRARQRLLLVTSVTPEQLPSGDTHYLRKFMEHAARPSDPAQQPDRFDSDFERQVAEALRARGLQVISQYPSCNYEIDLVVSDGQNSVAIECDGPSHFRPDGSYVTDDLPRHIVLTRSGWVIHRIPYFTWRGNAEAHLDRILELLTTPGERQRQTLDLPPPDATVRQNAAAAARTVVEPARPAKARKSAARKSASGPASPVSTSSKCSCGGRWIARTGRYGKFYGCSRYPRCRNTRNRR